MCTHLEDDNFKQFEREILLFLAEEGIMKRVVENVTFILHTKFLLASKHLPHNFKVDGISNIRNEICLSNDASFSSKIHCLILMAATIF